MNPNAIPMKVGTITPAICGSKYDSSSWSPRKYHGAFDGLGVALKFAGSSSGEWMTTDMITSSPVMASSAPNSISIRWGQVLTLSVGSALTFWIARALTTVSRRWVRTPSGVPAGGTDGRGLTIAATLPLPAPFPDPFDPALVPRGFSATATGCRLVAAGSGRSIVGCVGSAVSASETGATSSDPASARLIAGFGFRAPDSGSGSSAYSASLGSSGWTS
jgi:hypothetical protein